MKKYIYQMCMALLVSLLLSGCTDVLDKKNLKELVADDIWQDPVMIKGFMDNTMNDHLPGVNTGAYMDTWSELIDEGYGQYDIGLPYDNITISNASASNLGLGYIDQWYYGAIRNINKFIDNIDQCSDDKLPRAIKNDYIAQMKTLRAVKYFYMVRILGGVPLVLHEQSAAEDLYVSREKTSVCIAQIVRDLDDAIDMGDDFPMTRDDANAGRINRAMALAFKGRVLLYYASPQFSHTIGSGAKDAATRWNEAYAANKAAVEQLTAAGYGLFRPNPASAEEAIQNLKDMYSEANEIGNNPEMIWVRRYQWPAKRSPFAAPVILNQSVTIEHVNAYSRADGSPYTGIEIPAAGNIGTSSGVQNAPYWLDREPRFYASIAYNGMEHPMFRTNALPNDLDEQGKQIHWWKFSGGTQAPYYDCARLDLLAHNSVKLTDTDINETIADGNHSDIDWPLIRYAEVLLNLAECAAKTNHETEAVQILTDIRKRAGIPAGANNYGIGNPSGDELILAILNERRVELAFEGFRFWDVRRWRLFTDPIAGVKINGLMRHTLKPEPKVNITPEVLATIDITNDPDSYFAVFDNHVYVLDASPFSVSERQYFYRIDYENHIKKNPNLAQTNLWENGTFDPYE